ncbi:hypothetical protein EDD17DRAFT_1603749 [Pisolithus thermaeus]|nr:hypothetical protein EDD17DRAFT_1603749 [Pisolithus thermaeus]
MANDLHLHPGDALGFELTILFKTVIVTSFLVWFSVQCFYAHRVWIIGGRNMLLTGAVLAAALVQLIFGFGMCFTFLQN